MFSQKQNLTTYGLFFLIGCTAAVRTESLPNIVLIPSGDENVEVKALTKPGSAVMDLDQLIGERRGDEQG